MSFLCRPFVLKGYGWRSCANYVRGDPRSWRLEAEVDGQWVPVHTVDDYNFQVGCVVGWMIG